MEKFPSMCDTCPSQTVSRLRTQDTKLSLVLLLIPNMPWWADPKILRIPLLRGFGITICLLFEITFTPSFFESPKITALLYTQGHIFSLLRKPAHPLFSQLLQGLVFSGFILHFLPQYNLDFKVGAGHYRLQIHTHPTCLVSPPLIP